jgi:hypothetical protein
MDNATPASTPTPHAQPAATTRASDLNALVPIHSDLIIQGKTSIHIDPHCSSLTWCVLPSDSHTSDTVVRPNDFVIITSPTGEELFKGDIHPTFFVSDPLQVYHDVGGRKPPPSGFKIYWAPQGIDPYRWISLFDGHNIIHLHRHTTALLPAA